VSECFQIIAALFVADLAGGVFHLFVDHYASPTFWMTRAVVRDFREHHEDRQSMERYSRVPSVVLGIAGMLPLIAIAIYAGWYWAAGTLFVGAALTQHAHKYAHQANPPRLARLAQQVGLLISPEGHERHHGDFHRSYGVLNGWSHGVLDLALGRQYRSEAAHGGHEH
jgi:hypothetical protein